jgi:4-amino-4-deoxy-L-arabinose transferase-like glycosyltransferase
MWTIILVYKLADRLGGRYAAISAGSIAAAHGLMPFLAVRNLIEAVCSPFLLWGVYELTRAEDQSVDGAASTSWRWLRTGLALGIGFLIRWQIAAAMAGIAAYLLYRRTHLTGLKTRGTELGSRSWRGPILLAAGFAVPVLIQGVWDWSWHGIFLGSLVRYFEHNAAHAYSYVVGPWYRYLLLIFGVFIPPFSFLFVAGMGRWAPRLGVIPWAAGAFLLIHSLVPGKQERFLIPIMPLLIIMGAVGLQFWYDRGKTRLRRWIKVGWVFFWVVNIPLLVLGSLNYANKAKVEPLVRLYERGDVTGVVVDATETGKRILLPEYYLDGADPHRAGAGLIQVLRTDDLDSLRTHLAARSDSAAPAPNYVLIFTRDRCDAHVAMIGKHLGRVEILEHIGPSLAEEVLRFLNPRYHQSREVWIGRLYIR